eukprot:TRINITY_DN7220_c0_g1_i1.p1 TRINITY_DN7220_c0_g1~~TRINITY_DN7220_c0_g1_i1.p1  ORF type:complete len:888 (+),score=304.08 TRINITY_DN7220_c0_g1_i1:36-2699(+)
MEIALTDSNEDRLEGETLSEFSLYAANITSLSEAKDLQTPLNKMELKFIRVMHCNNLKSMLGCEGFTGLIELNLSSNAIEKIEGISELKNLRTLNLSCNKIRTLSGLSTLFKLERLYLPHNRISSLQYLKSMHGDNFSLKLIDLRDNRLSDLNELNVLGGLMKIEEIYFHYKGDSNPFCANFSLYCKKLISLLNMRTIRKVDLKNLSQITEAVNEEENSKFALANASFAKADTRVSPSAFNESKSGTAKRKSTNVTPQKVRSVAELSQGVAESGHETPSTATGRRTPVQSFKEDPMKPFKKVEEAHKAEIALLNQRNEELVHDIQELMSKFEANDEYWATKVDSLEEQFTSMTQENDHLKAKLDENAEENERLKRLCDSLNERIESLTEKCSHDTDTNEQLREQLEAMKAENESTKRENEELKERVKSTESQVGDLFEMVGQKDKRMTELQKKSSEQLNASAIKVKELQRRVDELVQSMEEKNKQIAALTDKNRELSLPAKEIESKGSNGGKSRNDTDSSKLKALEEKFTAELIAKEEVHKREAAELEAAVQGLIAEHTKERSELKALAEEKARSEAEAKETLKQYIARTAELESMMSTLRDSSEDLKAKKNLKAEEKIRELSEELKKVRSAYEKVLKESKRIEKDNSFEMKEVAQLNRQLEEQRQLVDKQGAEIKWYQAKLSEKETELERLKVKGPIREQSKGSDNCETKVEALEARLRGANEEVAQLRMKVESYCSLVKDYEVTVRELREEGDEAHTQVDTLNRQLNEKNKTIVMIEREVGTLREVQEREIAALQRKIKELQTSIEEHNASLVKKNEFIRELEQRILQKESAAGGASRSSERELREAKRHLAEKEEQLKTMAYELERQKRYSRENIEKLSQVLNK